jgi:hypothetical protein
MSKAEIINAQFVVKEQYSNDNSDGKKEVSVHVNVDYTNRDYLIQTIKLVGQSDSKDLRKKLALLSCMKLAVKLAHEELNKYGK